MKHKTNAPGLIVALGSPDGSATGQDDRSSLRSDAASRADQQSAIRNRQSAMANTDTVPLSMLSMPDDQEQMQPPEVGDVVNYQVTGKVMAIEGSYAEIQRQSINGQELPSVDEDPSSPGSDAASGDDGQALRGQAAGIGMLT